MNSNTIIKRGEVYYADLSPVVGSEQGGVRPVLVIQNDIGNMIEQAANSTFFDEYIERFEYYVKCFNYGNTIFEEKWVN